MEQPQNVVFVGQVPRDMSESELRTVMEECGHVSSVNMLTDRQTGAFKGCAFVTYENTAAATRAKETLHDQRRLHGANHPMQVTAARSRTSGGGGGPPGFNQSSGGHGAASDIAAVHQPRKKLFVGMLTKNMNDDELRDMFLPFGAVEDCVILRNPDKSSKGCAFVTMTSMEDCQKAIVALHNSQTFPGCSGPMVVKFADTPSQKENRQRTHTMPGPPPPHMHHSPMHLLPSSHHGPGQHRPPGGPLPGGPGSIYGHATAPPARPQVGGAPGGGGAMAGLQNLLAPTMAQLVKQQQELQQQQQTINQALQMLGLPGAAGVGGRVDYSSASPEAYSGGSHMPEPEPPAPAYGHDAVASQAASSNAGYRTGPEGANLFIYHLSYDATDSDLHCLFSPYGHVVSARVYCDRTTGQSKGFGFVSYDNAQSAQSAIGGLNGYLMGGRRLKVQLKKGRETARPY